MCQYRVELKNYPITNPKIKIGFVARDYAECGTCTKREWCPIYVISIRNRVNELLNTFGNVDDAMTEARTRYQGQTSFTMEYIYEGVIDFLAAMKENKVVKTISFQEGKAFLRELMRKPGSVGKAKELITIEEQHNGYTSKENK